MSRSLLMALLFALLTAGHVAPAVSEESAFVPHPPKGRGEHCVEPADVMRRNHMTLMKHQRDETVHEGVRGKPFSLQGCVDCHVVKGTDGQTVTYSDSRHFCRSCHDFAAVSIDCFECHSSRPGGEKPKGAQTALSAEMTAAAAVFQEARP